MQPFLKPLVRTSVTRAYYILSLTNKSTYIKKEKVTKKFDCHIRVNSFNLPAIRKRRKSYAMPMR